MGNQYTEKLSDPRWMMLRVRIIQRDGNICVQCRSTGELHVHHSHYRDGREPWEYRDADLHTLCSRCHEKVHGIPIVTPLISSRRNKKVYPEWDSD
jgi:5-methylcytosine-specific restriction endonuclease McrA